MAIPTLIAAILLIAVGITGYANQDPAKASPTALIPAYLGAPLPTRFARPQGQAAEARDAPRRNHCLARRAGGHCPHHLPTGEGEGSKPFRAGRGFFHADHGNLLYTAGVVREFIHSGEEGPPGGGQPAASVIGMTQGPSARRSLILGLMLALCTGCGVAATTPVQRKVRGDRRDKRGNLPEEFTDAARSSRDRQRNFSEKNRDGPPPHSS